MSFEYSRVINRGHGKFPIKRYNLTSLFRGNTIYEISLPSPLVASKQSPKEHHFGGPSWREDRAGELHCLRGNSKKGCGSFGPTGWRFPRKYTAFTNQKVEDVEVSSKYTAFFWSIQLQYMHRISYHRIIISEEFISYLTFAWWVYIPDMLWISNIFPVKKGAVLLWCVEFQDPSAHIFFDNLHLIDTCL